MSNQELEQVQQELSTNVRDLVKMAELCQVNDSNSANEAVQLTNTIKKTAKNIEEKRDFLVRPANEYVKSINNSFKEISRPLDEAKKNVDGKIISFQREQAKIEADKKRIEAEKIAAEMRLEAEKLREQNKEKQANLTEKAIEIVVAQKQEIKEEVKSLKSDTMPTFKIRKIARFKVEDIAALSAARPEFVIANESLIGQAVRGGERNIAGVKIWEEEIAG